MSTSCERITRKVNDHAIDVSFHTGNRQTNHIPRRILDTDPWWHVVKRLCELEDKETPTMVHTKPWSPDRCPHCGTSLSTHTGDGYYTHPTFLTRCPSCNQALLWPKQFHA